MITALRRELYGRYDENVAAKKSSGTKRPPRPRQSTIEVDPAWLDQLSEDEKPRSKRSRSGAPPTPASTPPSRKPDRNTIPVQSRWLIPPVPKEGKASQPPARPPPPPAATAVKPRGKLPPPLPREDSEDESKK
jgi:hypothetical protein